MELKTLTERAIEHLRGKYIKRTLIALETYYGGVIPAEIRKSILDGYNDFTRDLLTELGYGDK